MATNEERILAYLREHPEGATDSDLVTALDIRPHQQVNSNCRTLAGKGLITRERDPARGVIVNHLRNGLRLAETHPVAREPASAPGLAGVRAVMVELGDDSAAAAFAYGGALGLMEDQIKAALQAALTAAGWTVAIMWGKARGIDLVAEREGSRLIVEVKGEGSRNEMFNNYFLGALGELLQRMDAPEANYGLAFPAHRKFIRLATELPVWVRSRLKLTFYFVAPRDDGSYAIGVLEPTSA